MYSLCYSLQADLDRTITPALLDPAGAPAAGLRVLRTFTRADWYAFELGLPDGFSGYLAFTDDGVTLLELCAVNPQEAEYLDVPVSHASAGGGRVPVPLAVRSVQNQPVSGVQCWVTSDEGGTAPVAGVLATGDTGLVTFLLSPGTYWLWRAHPTVTFENPKRLDVTPP